MNSPNGPVIFRDERPAPESRAQPWRILIVDDDPEVHQATTFALESLEVAGKPMTLFHASNCDDALRVLSTEPDIAVVLLDVVMETPTAGLDLIDTIRHELGLTTTRIILRTGQPGYAPEIETIRRYEINDYKSKGELTQARLYAALSVALRNYEQLRSESRAREDLQQILDSGRKLRDARGQGADPGALLGVLSSYWDSPADGLLVEGPLPVASMKLSAGLGRYAGQGGRLLSAVAVPAVVAALEQSLADGRHVLVNSGAALVLRRPPPGQEDALLAFVHLPETARQGGEPRMLDMFCAHLALEWENEALVERLQHAAYSDSLTGLPNRAALVRHLEGEPVPAHGDQALAMIDIDQFSGVNDVFGHAYGDQLLRRAAARLRAALPPSVLVARISNDTFAIWGPSLVVQPSALRQHFSVPFVFDEIEHSVSVSIGLVRRSDAPEVAAPDLLKEAWIALKRAKLGGHGQDAWYTSSSARETREHARLLHALRAAFQRERLFLVYQPQVSLRTGAVVGLEALLRWKTDDGRFVPPNEFLPLAESSGLIVELGAWVLRRALQASKALADGGHPGLRMSVNVSAHQFAHPRFLGDLERVLRDEGVDAGLVELELTESVAVMGADQLESLLQRVRALGVTLAIDDFGTGYSSLSYLDRLPADRIKIDRSFVQVLNTRTRGARIAELVVPLGQQLGLAVLAEGVETQEQAEFLRALGCDEAQGFLYARPMPLEDLRVWLAQHGHPSP